MSVTPQRNAADARLVLHPPARCMLCETTCRAWEDGFTKAWGLPAGCICSCMLDLRNVSGQHVNGRMSRWLHSQASMRRNAAIRCIPLGQQPRMCARDSWPRSCWSRRASYRSISSGRAGAGGSVISAKGGEDRARKGERVAWIPRRDLLTGCEAVADGSRIPSPACFSRGNHPMQRRRAAQPVHPASFALALFMQHT